MAGSSTGIRGVIATTPSPVSRPFKISWIAAIGLLITAASLASVDTGLLIAVDAYGQIIVLDREQNLVSMFFVFRNQLAGWMPDGTRFGPAAMTGGPQTADAAQRIARRCWPPSSASEAGDERSLPPAQRANPERQPACCFSATRADLFDLCSRLGADPLPSIFLPGRRLSPSAQVGFGGDAGEIRLRPLAPTGSFLPRRSAAWCGTTTNPAGWCGTGFGVPSGGQVHAFHPDRPVALSSLIQVAAAAGDMAAFPHRGGLRKPSSRSCSTCRNRRRKRCSTPGAPHGPKHPGRMARHAG